MNIKQVSACYRKLAEIDEDSANEFVQLLHSADMDSQRATRQRQDAWAIYHTHFEPKRKQ